MIRRGFLTKLVVSFVVLMVVTAVLGGATFAAEGGSTGGGGKPGCSGYALSTCYGATWRYYETTSDSVSIDGYSSSGNEYARSETIVGCSKFGGYWRYAMVGSKTSGRVTEGEQFGVIGISNNSDPVYNSEFFGPFYYSYLGVWANGGMNYIPKSKDSRNADWDDVKALYEALAEAYPGEFTLGFDSGSNLAWFCGPSNIDDVDPNKFEGLVRVGDNTTWTSTDWRNGNYLVTQYIDCDSVNGCTAKFEHNLKRAAGTENLNYSIERNSNYNNVSSTTIASNVSVGFSGNNIPKEVRGVSDSTITMYPGQVVCETLSFQPSAQSGPVTLTACASAVGQTQPDDATLLDIKVKNNNVGKYSSYTNTVYAKPGDNLSYKTSYHPVLQYTYNLKPQKIQINGGIVYPTDGINVAMELGILFNTYKGNGLKNWNNGFSVYSEPNTFELTNYTYALGSTDLREEYENYAVRYNNVGYDLRGVAVTNRSDSTKTTPRQVTFVNDDDDNNVAQVDTRQVSDTADALVPYNYSATTSVEQVPEVAFAGETMNIKYATGIEKKINLETTTGAEGEAYATMARDVKERLIYYIDNAGTGGASGVRNWGNAASDLCGYYGLARGGNCDYMMDLSGLTLNSSGNANGSSDTVDRAVNVPDLRAGTRVCVAAAIYPASSGADTNILASGSDTWAISDAKCFVIAKRPSFQVWGGGLQAAGNVSAIESVKNNLAGIFAYNLNSKSNSVVFGSFVEQNVVAKGLVNGLASGAATGRLLDDAYGIGYGSLEGNDVSYCNRRVPLSFANYSTIKTICPYTYGGTQYTGLAGISISSNGQALIEYLLRKDNNTVAVYSGNVNLNTDFVNLESVNGRMLNYTKSTGDLTIVAGGTVQSTTQIVRADGTVRVNADLIYAGGTYTTLGQIPKLIIYADNIVIDCAVGRVDAVLIAENNVSTCDSGDVNARANSNQLIINGAILARSLSLNRTYGATVGAGSGVPAEIVNWDASATLWGKNLADNDGRSGFVTVYQHESSPRF